MAKGDAAEQDRNYGGPPNREPARPTRKLLDLIRTRDSSRATWTTRTVALSEYRARVLGTRPATSTSSPGASRKVHESEKLRGRQQPRRWRRMPLVRLIRRSFQAYLPRPQRGEAGPIPAEMWNGINRSSQEPLIYSWPPIGQWSKEDCDDGVQGPYGCVMLLRRSGAPVRHESWRNSSLDLQVPRR